MHYLYFLRIVSIIIREKYMSVTLVAATQED